MRLSDRRHFSFSTPIPRILTSFLRDLGNTTTPPSPAHGIAPLHSISRCNSGEAHLFPSASKPPRFLPSIAQKAISASSFGHHQFQPRAKNDTRLQPKGGAPPPRKHKSLGITQKTTRSRPDSISLKFTHRNSLKIHSFIQPATQSASRTQPRVSDWTLVKKSLDRWAPTYLPTERGVHTKCHASVQQRRDISTHIHPSTPTKPAEGKLDIHAQSTRGKGGHSPTGHPPLQDLSRRRPKSCELRNWAVQRRDWCVVRDALLQLVSKLDGAIVVNCCSRLAWPLRGPDVRIRPSVCVPEREVYEGHTRTGWDGIKSDKMPVSGR